MTTSWDCFAQYQKHSTCVCQYLNITCDILGFILLLLNLKHRESLLIITFMVGHEPVQLAFKARMRDKRIVLCRYSCRCNEEEEYLLATLDTNNSTSPSEVQELDRDLYLGVYAVFVICLLFFTLLRTQLSILRYGYDVVAPWMNLPLQCINFILQFFFSQHFCPFCFRISKRLFTNVKVSIPPTGFL